MKCRFFRAVSMAATIVISMAACTNQMDDFVLSSYQDTPNVVIQDTENSTDTYQYVLQHKDLFGNVLIFNTIDEVTELLQNMSSMDYVALRAQYARLQADFDFQNNIIESNIYYDSIYSSVLAEYGYNLLVKNVEIEDDNFFVTLEERLLAHNNGLLSVQSKQFASGETGTFIEPFGNLDWHALVNEKGLFIAGNVVYALVEGHWSNMPVDDYINNPTIQLNNQIATYSNNYVYNDAKKDKHHFAYNSDGDRMLNIDIDAQQTNVYLPYINFLVTLTISNYKKNTFGNWVKQWSHVTGKCECHIRCTTDQSDSGAYRYSKSLDGEYIKGGKSYTNLYTINEPANNILVIYPYDISINMYNWQGCQIIY